MCACSPTPGRASGIVSGVNNPSVDLSLKEVISREWAEEGECLQPHPDADWFPAQNQAMNAKTKKAIQLCHGCPVEKKCLLYALLTEGFRERGIWGGKTHKQRVAIRSEMYANGQLPIIRTCGACGKLFRVEGRTTHRVGVYCSTKCRTNRKAASD